MNIYRNNKWFVKVTRVASFTIWGEKFTFLEILISLFKIFMNQSTEAQRKIIRYIIKSTPFGEAKEVVKGIVK